MLWLSDRDSERAILARLIEPCFDTLPERERDCERLMLCESDCDCDLLWLMLCESDMDFDNS